MKEAPIFFFVNKTKLITIEELYNKKKRIKNTTQY